MNFKELHEGAEPKMPGAPSGIKIMTPQQFVAKAGDEEVDEDVTASTISSPHGPAAVAGAQRGGFQAISAASGDRDDKKHLATYQLEIMNRQAEIELAKKLGGMPPRLGKQGTGIFSGIEYSKFQDWLTAHPQVLDAILKASAPAAGQSPTIVPPVPTAGQTTMTDYKRTTEGVAEGQEHLDRIRSLSGLGEAIKLDAPYREFGGQEFQDYLTRIKGTPKIDNKTGQVKVGKSKISKKTGEVIPGKEQYVSGKIKKDKYTMPYIHRSSVITYLGPDGKTFSEDKIIAALKQRPVALLKQNEKMKHSNNEFEQFFNMGFAALTGIAVDESTNKLIIVNTCPGAGSCQVDCFMLAGGKIQFAGPWLSDGRNLTFILNDPEGYFKKMSDEIAKELRDGQKGSKKFPTGWQVSIRWHDAGDFFSKDYLDMTLKLAQQFPDVKFYAYTKMANAAMSKKLPNFIINWSEGAKSAQAKQVKAQDPNLERTKNSRIVPQDMFWDLLKKDEKGNLDKEGADAEGEGGRWVTRDPAATNELKQRLAKEYRISVNSILNYDEYLAKRKSIPQGMTYNVIVAPGEGDISAADRGVLSTLLLKHGNA